MFDLKEGIERNVMVYDAAAKPEDLTDFLIYCMDFNFSRLDCGRLIEIYIDDDFQYDDRGWEHQLKFNKVKNLTKNVLDKGAWLVEDKLTEKKRFIVGVTDLGKTVLGCY